MLSKRAQRELGKKVDDKLDKMAEKELRRFILEEHGGNGAEADEALQRRGMNRVHLQGRRKRDFLAQYVVESKSRRNRPVTYGEMLARYNEMKDQEFLREGVLQFRLIDIEVGQGEVKDPNEDPVQKARQWPRTCEENRCRRGFRGAGEAVLARSAAARRAVCGDRRDPNALAAPYDVLAEKAKNMEPGQVAGPIEAPGHFFIMKVEDKQDRGYQPLEEVQEQVREEIHRERRRAALEELEAEIRQQVALADTTQFVDYCLERFYRHMKGCIDHG